MTLTGEPAGRRRAPRRRSLRGKLILLVVWSVGIAVSLVSGVSAWRDGQRDATLQTERLRATAAVMGSLSAEATAVGDRAKAFGVLRSISLMPGVRYARIERADGALLAETGGGARLASDVILNVGTGNPGLLTQLQSRTSQVYGPIVFQGRRVGRLMLLGRTEGVLGQFLTSLEASLIAAAVAISVGMLVAWRLQRALTRPVLALTRSMEEIQRDHDYARAVEVTADDEIGELVQGFNKMLGEVRARDRRIADQITGLETEVAARTVDFREAKEAAEAANRAKSDFLATMSHEIRTPMNGIMVMAEMLAGGEMAPRQRRYAEVIANSGSSLLAIINDILDFSKIEAGKMELESMPVDLAAVVEDVCSLFWERAASKGLDLAAFVDPSLPHRIAADPVRLRQVIGNLVNNAIKFTDAGGVLVEVAADGPATLRVTVHDTGVGIPEDKIAGVFGAFSQADQSTTRRFGGTGLGLTICKRLVEAMGGRFSVHSRVGVGSSFAFQAPMTALEAAQPWPVPATAGAKVMVAHPGPCTRRALARYLQGAGYAVSSLQPHGDDQPCLVVADAAHLEQLAPSGVATVCVAAYGDSRPEELQRAGKVQAVLTQPFRRSDLERVLQQLQAGEPLSEPLADTASSPAQGAHPRFFGARVLVADDSAVNREVALEALARLAVTPRLVDDGIAAVAEAKLEAFDLILMDGSMPELDGYDAAREIRAYDLAQGRARTPIIALTAHVVGSAAEAWRDADMDAVLHKPFTLAALAEAVGRFLRPAEPPHEAELPVRSAAAPAPIAPASDLIDAEVAAQLAGMAAAGRGGFVERVHGLYRDNAPDCLARLADAVAADSSDAASQAAHALKSMSYNVGARRVSELASQIEAGAREGRTPTPREVAELGDVLSRTLASLAQPTATSAPAPAPAPAPAEAAASEAAELLRDLDRAVAEDQLSLVYQPQVDREGVEIVGVEALIRWAHPERGPISPALFIPLAEQHGRIVAITSWVVERALAETAHLGELEVAFNASAVDFADPGFVERLARIVDRRGYDPSRLVVEITETAILQNETQVRDNMSRLRERGMKMALDDFGAGYSSLGHLRRYPFEKLKIDREFVTDCSRDVQSATVVHAVVSIGRALGMKVVAEGVETEVERRFLKVAGVHAMQGYLFGKGVSIGELEARLAATPRALAVG